MSTNRKPFRFPRWMSWAAFAAGRPAFWFWNITGDLGRFLAYTEFLPARFTCCACGEKKLEFRLRSVCGYPNREVDRRICKRCHDDVPF